MKSFQFKSKKIAYADNGAGPVVVLLHGFCEDKNMWDDFIKHLNGYRILRIDLPGFGESDVLKNTTIEEMAEVVKEMLHHEKVEKCNLIGHSMGGYVALAFAEKYKKMLTGIGLFHSHPFADNEDIKKRRIKSCDFMKRHGHFELLKQLVPRFFAPKFAKKNKDLINDLIFRASFYNPEGIIEAQNAMMLRKDRTTVLKNSNVPVLFIVGLEDLLFDLNEGLEQTYLPEIASIHLLEGVGHGGMFEAEKKTGKQVKMFLDFCYSFG